MKDNILFSVLIANYNNGIFLKDAINSVLTQSYANWEIIIVDDASNDCSKDIYKQLANDERIRIFYNDKNYGCGYTKRRCIEFAKGDICGFLDPDDTLEEEALEIMVAEHLKNTEASMIYSRYYYSDLGLNKLGISKHQRSLPDGISFLEFGKGAISHFVAFKKTSYDKTPGIDACYKRAVDHALYFLLEEVGKIVFIDKPLYNYRSATGHNISTESNSSLAFYWDLIVMTDACRRRGLNIEKIVFSQLDDYIDDGIKNAILQGMDLVRSTKTYKLGAILSRPFKIQSK